MLIAYLNVPRLLTNITVPDAPKKSMDQHFLEDNQFTLFEFIQIHNYFSFSF